MVRERSTSTRGVAPKQKPGGAIKPLTGFEVISQPFLSLSHREIQGLDTISILVHPPQSTPIHPSLARSGTALFQSSNPLLFFFPFSLCHPCKDRPSKLLYDSTKPKRLKGPFFPTPPHPTTTCTRTSLSPNPQTHYYYSQILLYLPAYLHTLPCLALPYLPNQKTRIFLS